MRLGRTRNRLEKSAGEHCGIFKNRGLPKYVFEFPHIAGPRMLSEFFEKALAEPGNGPIQLQFQPRKESVAQDFQIIFAVA